MASEFMLLHYYAFYGNIAQFQAIYTKFMSMGKEELSQKFLNIAVIDDQSYLTSCLEHGCMNSFEFADYLYNAIKNGDIKVYDESCRIIQSISNRFIMSNVVNNDLIKERPPFLIWYPSTPSKETCLELLKEFADETRYQIAMVAILNNWVDLYFKLNVKSETYLYSLAKLLNRKEIANHQQEFEPISGHHHSILYLDKQKLDFDGSTSPHIFDTLDIDTFLIKGIPYMNGPAIYKDNYFARRYSGEMARISPPIFEYSFLHILLDGRPKDIEGFDFTLSLDEDEVSISKIQSDSDYALRVFHKFPERFGRICVERFISIGYLNKRMVNKYVPFTWSRDYFAYPHTYSEMIDQFGRYEFNILVGITKSHRNEAYFQRDPDPELEVFRVAALCRNMEVYNDHLRKARKLRKFFRYLDTENECLIYPPQEVPIEEVDLITPEFAYEMYTFSGCPQISLVVDDECDIYSDVSDVSDRLLRNLHTDSSSDHDSDFSHNPTKSCYHNNSSHACKSRRSVQCLIGGFKRLFRNISFRSQIRRSLVSEKPSE